MTTLKVLDRRWDQYNYEGRHRMPVTAVEAAKEMAVLAVVMAFILMVPATAVALILDMVL